MKVGITAMGICSDGAHTYHLSSIGNGPSDVLFIVRVIPVGDDPSESCLHQFSVEFATGWDDVGRATETEEAVTGSFKWDGCTELHIDRHLCGGERVAEMQFVLWWVWSQLPKTMAAFDPDEAGWANDGKRLVMGEMFDWPPPPPLTDPSASLPPASPAN